MRLFSPSRKIILAIILLNLIFFSGLLAYLGYGYYFDGIGKQVEVSYPIVQTDDQTLYWWDYGGGGEFQGNDSHSISLTSLGTNNVINTVEFLSTQVSWSFRNRILEVPSVNLFAAKNDIWLAFNIALVNRSRVAEQVESDYMPMYVKNYLILIKGEMENNNPFSYAIIESPNN